MAEQVEQVKADDEKVFSSPPAAPAAVNMETDPRARLLELVRELRREQSRRLLAEYMRLRRGLSEA